jgi:hypothetical protein
MLFSVASFWCKLVFMLSDPASTIAVIGAILGVFFALAIGSLQLIRATSKTDVTIAIGKEKLHIGGQVTPEDADKIVAAISKEQASDEALKPAVI